MADTALLLAIPLLPVIGAAVAVVVPADDRLTLRAVGMVTTIGAAVVAAVAAAGELPPLPVPPSLRAVLPLLTLTPLATPALLTLTIVAPLALRAGAPRVQGRVAAYVVAVCLHTALSALSILSARLETAVVCAMVAAVPAFALLALFGGAERGSVTWRAAALWLVVDVSALAFLVSDPVMAGPWPPALAWVAICGPGLVRLAAGPHGLWALPTFEMGPVSSAALSAGVGLPVGLVLLVRGASAAPATWGQSGLALWVLLLAGAIGVGAIVVVVERDLRRVAAHWTGILGSVAALGALAAVADGRSPAWAIGLACQGGLAIAFLVMVVEAIERRLESRSVVQLAGLADAAPALAVALPLAVLLVAGAPGPGSALSLWHVIVELLGSAAPGAAGAAAWSIIAVVVAAAGAAATAARVVLPLRRRHESFIRVSFMQGIRLAFPLAVMVTATAVLPALLSAVEAGR